MSTLPQVTPRRLITSFQVASPVETHTRSATCAEVECRHYLNGWASEIDVSAELGQHQAAYIETRSGRRFVKTRRGPDVVRFEFAAGQECFNSGSHRVSLDRPSFFTVRHGNDDPRGFERGDQWTEDFNHHIDKLKG